MPKQMGQHLCFPIFHTLATNTASLTLAYITSNSKNLDDLKINTQITSNQNVISIGNFSNLLIKDKGFDGIAIKLGGDFAKIKIENDYILVVLPF